MDQILQNRDKKVAVRKRLKVDLLCIFHQYAQQPWLARYTDYNTEMRAKVRNGDF